MSLQATEILKLSANKTFCWRVYTFRYVVNFNDEESRT